MIKLWLRLCYFVLIVDIIHISWISSAFRGYILWISWIYPHFVDIICIGHITSYLARNVYPIFLIYSSSVSDWCKSGDFMVIDFTSNISRFILVRRICTSHVSESGDSLVIDFTFNIRRFILVHRICTSRDPARYHALYCLAPNFEHYSTGLF